MKSVVFILALFLVGGHSVTAQKKVKERDLKGHWQMVFDLDEDFIEEEIEGEDIPWLGEIIAKGVSGIALEILDEVNVRFEFQKDNQLKVMVDAFGDENVEYAHWHIDSKGALVLDDNDDDDDIWLFDQHKLYAYERRNGSLKKQPVYLKRVN
jgi:hypothetical protein